MIDLGGLMCSPEKCHHKGFYKIHFGKFLFVRIFHNWLQNGEAAEIVGVLEHTKSFHRFYLNARKNVTCIGIFYWMVWWGIGKWFLWYTISEYCLLRIRERNFIFPSISIKNRIIRRTSRIQDIIKNLSFIFNQSE